MSDTGEFLDAYRRHRVEDQRSYYGRRRAEYARASEQASVSTELLLFAAALCGVAGTLWDGQARWFGVVAAGLSALGIVVRSWADVVGFTVNADLYEAAENGLRHADLRAPSDGADDVAISAYVEHVEQILRGETRSWEQTWGKRASAVER